MSVKRLYVWCGVGRGVVRLPPIPITNSNGLTCPYWAPKTRIAFVVGLPTEAWSCQAFGSHGSSCFVRLYSGIVFGAFHYP